MSDDDVAREGEPDPKLVVQTKRESSAKNPHMGSLFLLNEPFL
jgi:hypothetical protein